MSALHPVTTALAGVLALAVTVALAYAPGCHDATWRTVRGVRRGTWGSRPLAHARLRSVRIPLKAAQTSPRPSSRNRYDSSVASTRNESSAYGRASWGSAPAA